MARRTFPSVFGGKLWRGPRLRRGEHIARHIGKRVLVVDGGRRRRAVVESTVPLRAKDEAGHDAPIDTTLIVGPDGLRPRNSSVATTIASDGPAAASLDQGIGVEVAGGRGAHASVDRDKAMFANVLPDTDVVAAAMPEGVDYMFQLRSSSSPETPALDFTLPAGASLDLGGAGGTGLPDGASSARIVKDGRVLAQVNAPMAVDADGRPVPVSYGVRGDRLEIRVEHAQRDVRYPILVDPYIVESFYFTAPAGVPDSDATGWSFSTYAYAGTAMHSTASGPDGIGLYAYVSPGDSLKTDEYGAYRWKAPAGANIFEFRADTKTVPFYGYFRRGIGIWNDTNGWESGNPTTTIGPEPYTYNTVCAAAGCPYTGGRDGNEAWFYYQATTAVTTPSPTPNPSAYAEMIAGDIWLNDSHPPTVATPTGAWNDGQWHDGTVGTVGPFTLSASDLGLGLHDLDVETDSTLLANPSPTCAGNRTSPCPTSYSASVSYSATDLPEGISTEVATATDVVGQTGTTSWQTNIDNSPPNIALTGTLNDAAASPDHRIDDRNYSLHIDATDGSTDSLSSQRSGVKSVTIKVDGRTASDASWTQPCPASNCYMSKDWTLNSERYAAGDHTIQVLATDQLGHQSTASRTVTVGHAAAAGVGPGSVNLLTGNFTLDRSDAKIDATGSGLSVTRTYNSRDLGASVNSPFGPGWTPGMPVDGPGGEWVQLDVVQSSPNVVEVTTADGDKVDFTGSSFTPPPGFEDLTLSAVGATYELKDLDGNITVFKQVTTGSGNPYLPSEIRTPSGSSTATASTISYEIPGTGPARPRIKQVTAPTPAGLAQQCTASLTQRGCRALTFEYANTTTASSGIPGDFTGRVARIKLTAWDPNGASMSTTDIAQYAYDTQGRLAAAWDPRISPALKEQYSYDSAGDLTGLTPPGEQPWTLGYAEVPPAQPGDPLPGGDPAPSAPSQSDPPPPAQPGDPLPGGDPAPTSPPQSDPPPPAQPGDPLPGGDPAPTSPFQSDPPPPAQEGDPLPGGDPAPVTNPNDPNAGRLVSASRAALPGTATTTVVYNVPTTGSGAPYAMGSSDVAAWGQSQAETPATATAIFPPDQVPADQTPTDYSHATIHYLDAQGREVNEADPGGRISTTEYDARDNVIRELSAANRERALAAGSSSATRAGQIDTVSAYNPDGTLLVDERGPLHTVKLPTGESVDARSHTQITYDQGAPSGGPYGLPTTTTHSALKADGTDVDTRTKISSYDGQSGLGWKLRTPTSETVDPGGLNLTTTTLYASSSGQVVEERQPANPAGGDAHAKLSLYFSAASTDPDCTGRPEWDGLLCKEKPAAQPGTAGLAPLAVTTYTYNRLGEQTTTTETIGGSATRTTTISYDSAGRPVSTSISASEGDPVPDVINGYDSATGRVTTTTAQSASGAVSVVSRQFDTLGRLISYTDADGNVSTTAYDIDSRPVTKTDGKATQTYTYDPITGDATQIADSGIGTMSATYNADGQLKTETLPGGLQQQTIYDETGQPTRLAYVKTTNCTSNCTWLDSSGTRTIRDQWATMTSNLSSQAYTYDKAGRLTEARDTPAGSGCTVRSYSYDADTNRTMSISHPAAADGSCAPSSAGTSTGHSYDAADRLTDAGVIYDSFGRETSLPATDNANKGSLTLTYYQNDLTSSMRQGSITKAFTLDPALRQRTEQTIGGDGQTRTLHYSDDSDSPGWVTESSDGLSWSRPVEGFDGDMVATQSETGATLMLSNLHGDTVAEASPSATATGPSRTYETEEFGIPKSPSAGRFGWLGSNERRTQFADSGVISMGVRTYVPGMGRFTSPDPVVGGSANDYDYANQDPVNQTDLGGTSPAGPHPNVGGASKVYRAWRFFRSKGLTKVGAAALIGNLREESHLNPRLHEYGGGKGRGIAQWSVDDRWQNLLDWAHARHKSPTSFAVQLQFVWHELTTGYRGVLHLLRHAHHGLAGVTTRVAFEYEMAGTVRPEVRIRCARRTLHHPRGRPGGEC